MRTVRIGEEVWQAIAARGKFGETEDDVLRRVLGIDPAPTTEQVTIKEGQRGRGNVRFATRRMSARVESGQLVVEFEGGASRRWSLPARTDKEGIRAVRDAAVLFAREQRASDPGQTNAVRKALTDAGYHLTK